MNMDKQCEVIRDLLPLYADDVCSDTSRRLIEEHLEECPDCSAVLKRIRASEIEDGLREEKEQVIEHQAKQFRRRSATIGSTVSGLFMIPIVICLIVNLTTGRALDWFYMVLGGLAIVASWTLVPLLVQRNRLFWSFCSFCLSLLFTLAVCCFYTHGDWFFLVASAVLFAFSLAGLPFALRAEPVRPFIGSFSKPVIVASVDLILFTNMMNMITLHSKSIITTGILLALCIGGLWLLGSAIKSYRGENE